MNFAESYFLIRKRKTLPNRIPSFDISQEKLGNIIKPADKSSAVVIIDKQYYSDKGIRQLSNIHFSDDLPTDLSDEVMHKIRLHVQDMCSRARLLSKQLLI